MKPVLNPNHNREAGTLNTVTHVLVLMQNYADTALWTFFSNFFARNNYRRQDHLPQRGQIVAYRSPYNPTRIATKRVVGLPGDRVTPLDGYPGGPEPVIIPWNHLWLEGDVEDRELSLDSNYFGPVSANLVIGTVAVTLPYLTPVRWKDATYPAQARVEHNIVPQHNPDDETRRQAFIDGRAAQDLQVVKAYPLDRPLMPMERQQWQAMYQLAADEMARKDTQTYELASALAAELRAKLNVKAVKETLKNVSMSKEEFERFQKDGVVPETVLARTGAK
jgi:Signal peptidase, peptidase S26